MLEKGRGEQDEDKEGDIEVDPPEGFVRIRPSKFNLIPGTVFVEYPKELVMVRPDRMRSALESLHHKQGQGAALPMPLTGRGTASKMPSLAQDFKRPLTSGLSSGRSARRTPHSGD